MLDVEEAGQRGRGRGLALAFDRLLDLDVHVGYAAARHRHVHGPNTRHGSPDDAEYLTLFGQAAEPVRVAHHDVVPVSVATVGNGGHFQQRRPALRAAVTRVLAEGRFWLPLSARHI